MHLYIHDVENIAVFSTTKCNKGTDGSFFTKTLTIKSSNGNMEVTLFSSNKSCLEIDHDMTVTLSQRDGIVEVVAKPDNVKVKLFDYDLDGVEPIDIEGDSEDFACVVTNWE